MVKVKAPLSSLEACIIDGIKDIQANNIKFHNIAFDCWTIEDYEGRVFMRKKTGKWIATYSDSDGDVWVSWKCSNCGYVRKKGWKYTDDGKKPDALFCEMCNADMRGEQDD